MNILTTVLTCILCITASLFAGKTVLITGGAGFLGSHLCDRMIQQGNKVICLDLLSSGSLDNIAHLMDNPSFSVIVQDVSLPLAISEPIDEIYNLACPASPDFYQRDPVHTLKTNFLGMLNVLELAAEKHAKVLHASTSEVYGDPLIHPQHEDYWGNVNPYGLRSCYDEGKRVAEALCFAYRTTREVDIKLVRIFNTFGPRMHPKDGRVVSNFIMQALKGEPLTIYGDGTQTRSLCYVDDLMDGFVLAMGQPASFGGPVNLGNPSREMSVLKIAETIIALTATKSAICFKPLPLDDPKMRQPDISLAMKILDWHPKISIQEGLKRTITYYLELLNAKNSHGLDESNSQRES